jgi:hypothetical protein
MVTIVQERIRADSRGKEDVISTHSEESARELPANPDLRHLEGQANDLVRAGRAPTLAKAALTAAKTVVRWLRWAAVLGLVYSAWGGLFYDVVLGHMFFFSSFLFVAAGAKIAPRNRGSTAIVLAAALVLISFRGHVLSNPPPGVTHYQLTIAALRQIAAMEAAGPVRHFTLETSGAVLGVVCIFWSERARASVASVRPRPAATLMTPPHAPSPNDLFEGPPHARNQ